MGAVRRHHLLPAQGTLMISADLHGNLEDFEALRRHFQRALDAGEDRRWVLLGDLVHGPDEAAAAAYPTLYGYDDASPALVDAAFELQQAHPGRVLLVLGNHDAGHLGMARTAKFHGDEVAALEERLSLEQRHRLQALFGGALLAVVAPCGLVLTHGAPGDQLQSLAQLDGPLPPEPDDEARRAAVHELLWSYGQRADVAHRMLLRLSVETGLSLRVVVHGHDRDEHGWFSEGGNQLQPVIFGAPREQKRYLVVDLAGRYETAAALEPALRRVHG